jgi:retron-type reverse transcriptase
MNPPLIQRIAETPNLMSAYRKARLGKSTKPDQQAYSRSLRDNLRVLQSEIRSMTWMPGPLREFTIYEPKERLIAAAPFRDRVMHHALMNILEPILEKRQISHSYACRKGKGNHACVKQAYNNQRHYPWVLKMDIRKYFPSIDLGILKSQLRKIIWDPSVLVLLDRILDAHGVHQKNLPIGNLTSQHLANLYLSHLDHFVLQHLRPKAYVRYMDDFVLWGESQAQVKDWHLQIPQWLERELSLSVKTQATECVPVIRGISFLGYQIYPAQIRLNQRSCLRLRSYARSWAWQIREGVESVNLSRQMDSVVGWISQAHSFHFREGVLLKHCS